MSAPPRRLLDSYAILVLLADEEGAARVADLLREAIETDVPLLVNEINVGEVYYIVARHRSLDDAERALDHLESLPVEVVGNTLDDVLDAARVKAKHPLSYADAFAVATAARFDATVVTGDREFEAVETIVDVEWI
ncbi:MAG: type II toxin-antitoxin system VapC family toxin [Gemmatimonadetes bacterium]|nr:type II toxin-antitoxin system VapC family toxin [Gemmatimonadota bacterium]NNL29406.1 type II toxin-antitoxin system VapC family toxin [Gemmatimonadota bacterium]